MSSIVAAVGITVFPTTSSVVNINRQTDSGTDTLPQGNFDFPGLDDGSSAQYSGQAEQQSDTDDVPQFAEGLLFTETVVDSPANELTLLPAMQSVLSPLPSKLPTEQTTSLIDGILPLHSANMTEQPVLAPEEIQVFAEAERVSTAPLFQVTDNQTVSAQQYAVSGGITANPQQIYAEVLPSVLTQSLPAQVHTTTVVAGQPATAPQLMPAVVLPVATAVPQTDIDAQMLTSGVVTDKQVDALNLVSAHGQPLKTSALLFNSQPSMFAASGGGYKAENMVVSPVITPVSLWQSNSPESVFQWRSENLGQQSAAWGQKLLHLLSDKVDLQLGQHIQRAQIRLDPPHLGAIELSIQVDGERTSVQLYASSSQVRDAMMQTLEQLRQTLSQRLGGEMAVEVSVRQHSEQHSNKEQQQSSSQIAAQAEFYDETATESETYQQQNTEWLNRLV